MSAIPEPSRTGTVEFDGHRTWYRVTGELDPESPRAPLLVVHGGPGAGHDYCLAMTSLAGDDRAVVHYDQLGCGRSAHLPDADPACWTVGLFVRELRTVVDALGISARFHLLDQSWGGMLAPEFMLADGAGVLSLTIAAARPRCRSGWRRRRRCAPGYPPTCRTRSPGTSAPAAPTRPSTPRP
jgi:L-proline amide hydrolase